MPAPTQQSARLEQYWKDQDSRPQISVHTDYSNRFNQTPSTTLGPKLQPWPHPAVTEHTPCPPPPPSYLVHIQHLLAGHIIHQQESLACLLLRHKHLTPAAAQLSYDRLLLHLLATSLLGGTTTCALNNSCVCVRAWWLAVMVDVA